jgi:RHS repeat-associated protein
MSKTVGATKSSFVWDLSGELPSAIGDGTNAYIYGPGGEPLEQISGKTPLWLQHDQLGSTRLLINARGQAVATEAYTPYGRVATSSGTASTPLLFAGEYMDSESGLYYLLARYYDPTTAQFLTRDPAAASTRVPYSYVRGNPVNLLDPAGLDACAAYSEHYLCESTLQYCSTSATIDECHQVGQMTVDTYNEVERELANLCNQTGSAVAAQVTALRQAERELRTIFHVIQTGAPGEGTGLGSLCLSSDPSCKTGARGVSSWAKSFGPALQGTSSTVANACKPFGLVGFAGAASGKLPPRVGLALAACSVGATLTGWYGGLLTWAAS